MEKLLNMRFQQKGFINENEILEIKKDLQLDLKITKNDLQELRNNVCKMFAEHTAPMIENVNDTGWLPKHNEYHDIQDTLSAVTSVIDNKFYSIKGGC